MTDLIVYWREILLIMLALACALAAAYLLGERQGEKFYWWKLAEPEPEEPAEPEEVEPYEYLDPDTVTIDVVIVPTPLDFEDTITSLEARAIAAESEAQRQERLKQQHIKDKAKLRDELHGYTLTEPIRQRTPDSLGFSVSVFLDGLHVHTAEGRTKGTAVKAANDWIDEDMK